VYVLGDLYDWWIGDDQLGDPFAYGVAESLQGIAAAGIPLFVAHGNRDFLLGERFVRTSGAVLLPEQTIVDLYGTRTLVTHGDELCTSDVDYQRYRARVRDPAFQRRALRMPYVARRVIASWLRRKSSAATALKPEAITDVALDAVDAAFRKHDVTRMIHGHTHRPARHHHAVDSLPRERFVLADWHDRGHWLEVDAGGARTVDLDA
jgi:UDP-2,3-diacylglucosamine hydrolase